jgi:capsule polysaccharide modification protein KpsS
MVSEPTSNWDSLVLSSTEDSALDKYMSSRWRGENDWIKFSDTKVDRDKSFKDKSDFYLALTSVTWDAEIHYESRAFENMREWLVTTIEYFKVNSNQELVIRVHPAEITSPNKSRESMFSFVNSLDIERFPNITVIKPDSNVSTYNLIEKSRAVIVYNTKTGIEAAYRNKPVIVAGESWIRGKGIGWDANNPLDYIKILDLFKDSVAMSPIQSLKAKQYAYHFFFRRMIRVAIFAKPHSSEWLFPTRNVNLKDLVGRNDQNFQEILSGITESRTPIARTI